MQISDYKLSTNLIKSSKYNVKRTRRMSQAFLFQRAQVSSIVAANPLRFVLTLSKSQRSILNKILQLQLKYPKLCMKQATLGAYVGISREWANKCLRLLEEHGCILRNYMHMYINFYKVSSFFFRPEIRRILSGVLPALRYMCLSLLTLIQPSNASIDQKFTHTILEDKYIKRTVERLSIVRETIVTERLSTKSSRESHTIAKESMKFKRERVDGRPVSKQVIALTKVLGLTALGQFKFSVFPDEVIDYALAQYKYANNINDPYKWFMRICLDYAKSNGIEPDWFFASDLILQYKINPTGPVTDNKHKQTVQSIAAQPTDQWTPPAARVDDPVQLKIDRENWYVSKTPDFMRRLLGSEEAFAQFTRACIDPDYQSPVGKEAVVFPYPQKVDSNWKSMRDLFIGYATKDDPQSTNSG
jgi:DNA-binding Lrp family transcriptional regulator